MTGTEPERTHRTLRTAVVGFGLSGSVFHAPLIAADPSYSLDVVATSDAGRQAAVAERYRRAGVARDARPVRQQRVGGKAAVRELAGPVVRRYFGRWRSPAHTEHTPSP